MNQDQFLGMLKIAVSSLIAYVVGKGWIPAGAASDVGAAVVAVGAAWWSYRAHSDSAKISAVTALPDVKKIVTVQNPANPAVAAAAQDSSQTKVAPAP
jgi:hypothetical protein